MKSWLRHMTHARALCMPCCMLLHQSTPFGMSSQSIQQSLGSLLPAPVRNIRWSCCTEVELRRQYEITAKRRRSGEKRRRMKEWMKEWRRSRWMTREVNEWGESMEVNQSMKQ